MLDGRKHPLLLLFEDRCLTRLFGRGHIPKSKIETPPGHPRRNPIPRGEAAKNGAADDDKDE
jgi:hypothetical protein